SLLAITLPVWLYSVAIGTSADFIMSMITLQVKLPTTVATTGWPGLFACLIGAAKIMVGLPLDGLMSTSEDVAVPPCAWWTTSSIPVSVVYGLPTTPLIDDASTMPLRSTTFKSSHTPVMAMSSCRRSLAALRYTAFFD